MTIIVFEEKHGLRYIQSEDREAIFNHILSERIEDGYWYDTDEAMSATEYLNRGEAEAFLASRKRYEYEGYYELIPETVCLTI